MWYRGWGWEFIFMSNFREKKQQEPTTGETYWCPYIRVLYTILRQKLITIVTIYVPPQHLSFAQKWAWQWMGGQGAHPKNHQNCYQFLTTRCTYLPLFSEISDLLLSISNCRLQITGRVQKTTWWLYLISTTMSSVMFP